MSLKDLMYRDRVNRDYGTMVEYQDPRPATSLPQAAPTIQAMPTTQPLPPIETVEDFLPEDFMPNVAVLRPTECETLTQTEAIRQGENIPMIHQHSNAVLREKHLHDVRCPSCGLEFATEVES